MDRLPPQLAAELARQYDVLRMLGQGGMGTVWLARERSLDRLVAIKILGSESIQFGDLRERFRREARIAARLMHPNIVPLYAFGETPDALYLVMGYVEGESLAARLEREGRLPRHTTLRILAEIADALAFAHREGVVHRDVKPDNILIEAKSGRAMLADFGIARAEGAATSVTMTGMAVGTPSYMSPEQAAGTAAVDGRADVYSLSVVGYRMLAGKLPFAGTSLQALMAQHAVQKPDDLALAVARPDRGVARVVMRGLEKDPAMRWARADDLRDMIRLEADTAPELPEELDRIDATGTKMLIPLFFFSSLAYAIHLASGVPAIAIMSQAIFAGMLGTIAAVRSRPAIKSFGWKETLRTLFAPPRWWSSWWPRALRRADDQWDRLPRELRRFRAFRDLTIGVLIVHVGVVMPVILNDVVSNPVGDALFMFDLAAMLGGTIGAFITARAARRVLLKAGLSRWEASTAGALPNVASHYKWKNPMFARLLAAAPEATRATPRTPEDYVRGIEDLNPKLVRVGLLPDDDCVSAARAVKAAIDALEREVIRLNQELDPAEGERLSRRIAALGSEQEDAELRRLLESQRAVWQRLDERRRDKEARRDRLRDQLMTLWMQLLDMDARASRGSPVDPELTGQVRALSQDLARAGAGLAEAERVLARPDSERIPTPT
ncbi:MAG: protein kinase [Gemmatimonadaceae bacterium]